MMRVLLAFILCVLILASSESANAEDAGAMPAADAAVPAAGSAISGEPSSLFSDRGGVDPTRALLMRWFGVMGLLAVVGGLAWFLLKRGRFAGFTARRGQMHVVDRLFLGPKRSIQVVQIGTKQLVVGITEMQITTLGELEEGALVSVESGPGQAGSAPFSSFLQGANARDKE